VTYNPNIPQNLPSPKVITSSIRTNFSEYANIFDNNHEAINNSNQGKHTNVILQEITDPNVLDNLVSLYGKSITATSGTTQEMFAKILQFLPSDKPNIPMQLTFNQINTAGPQYQSFLAGGNIVYFGQTSNLPADNPITLSPTPSVLLCVIANANTFASPQAVPYDVSVFKTPNIENKFTIVSRAASVSAQPYLFTWIAIARQ